MAQAPKNPTDKPSTAELLASQPKENPENIAETPEGEKMARDVAPPEQFQKNVTNVDVAPVPRNQMDEDVQMDPMKRQPGVAPLQSPEQAVDPNVEEGEQDYVMVMPYWDGIQLWEKGSILPFKPSDAPFGAKAVTKEQAAKRRR